MTHILLTFYTIGWIELLFSFATYFRAESRSFSAALFQHLPFVLWSKRRGLNARSRVKDEICLPIQSPTRFSFSAVLAQEPGVADNNAFDRSVDGDGLHRDGDLGSGDDSDSIGKSAIVFDGDKDSSTGSEISSVGTATCKTTVTDDLSARASSMSQSKSAVCDSPVASDGNWTASNFDRDEKEYPGRDYEDGPAAEESETPAGKYPTTISTPGRTTVTDPRGQMHDLPVLNRLGAAPLLPFSVSAVLFYLCHIDCRRGFLGERLNSGTGMTASLLSEACHVWIRARVTRKRCDAAPVVVTMGAAVIQNALSLSLTIIITWQVMHHRTLT